MSSTARWSRRPTFPRNCAGTPPASGSGRTAIWCTTRCAAASSTTSSSPSTAARPRMGRADGSKEEVQSYFHGISPEGPPAHRPAESWRRWATADREPIANWCMAASPCWAMAHPTTQYLAQGACMAMEDAVTLGEALRENRRPGTDWPRASALPAQPRRPHRAHRAVQPRDGRLYHARASSAWCATTCGAAVRPSASRTRWNGSTAGTSATA